MKLLLFFIYLIKYTQYIYASVELPKPKIRSADDLSLVELISIYKVYRDFNSNTRVLLDQEITENKGSLYRNTYITIIEDDYRETIDVKFNRVVKGEFGAIRINEIFEPNYFIEVWLQVPLIYGWSPD